MDKYEGATIIVVEEGKATHYPYSQVIEEKLKYEYSGGKKNKSPANICWDCGTFYNCPKIWHEVKKTIEEYPFIEEGYCVISKDGEIMTFAIHKCSKFTVPPPQKKYTNNEKKGMFEELEEHAKDFGIDTTKVPDNNIYEFPKRNKKKVKKK